MKIPYRNRNVAPREFHESLLTDYVREIVYGASDGVVTTFAVIAGFSGANQAADTVVLSASVVILIGMASLLADGVSMGLGDYLSSRAELDVYRSLLSSERSRLEQNSREMAKETHTGLVNRGFSEEDSHKVLDIFRKNHSFWVEWIVHEQNGVPDPGASNPWMAAIATSLSFLVFGSIPLALFWLYQDDPTTAFLASLVAVVACWVVIAYLRWSAVGHGIGKSFSETFFVGALSSGISFLVGTLVG